MNVVERMLHQRILRILVPEPVGARRGDRLLACLGALIGIALTSLACLGLHVAPADLPLLVAPLGASAVILFVLPASPLAQPWAIFGGNVVSAIVGVAAARLIPDVSLAAGIAVGGAILVMSVLRCLHPPGGAAALTAVIGGPAITAAGFSFALVPVAINSLLLLAIGWGFHRLSGHSYPHRVAAGAELPQTLAFHAEDIDHAIAAIRGGA